MTTRAADASILGGLPAWWRALAWGAIIGYTTYAAPTTARQVATGVVMVVAALAMQLTGRDPRWQRAAAVSVATAGGLAGLLLSPSGLAEVPLFMAATRIPGAFTGRALWAFVAVDTVAAGLAVGWMSHSLAGLLAGLGIPLLVQRSAAQQEVVRQRDRAEALLVEVQAGRESEAQAAALRERGRIAREMHDVLAHSLAGLSLQLQAARAVAAREGVGPAVLEPLAKAADLARDGLAEARSVVRTLRDPAALGVDALPALVQRHPGTATLQVCGTPAVVSAEAGHAVYRIVQEALTNAARYAPGSPVAVVLDWLPGELTVRVEDSGPLLGHIAVAGQGTGLGLAGMQERVGAVGGTLHAGPRPEGGWRVEAVIPLEVG